MRVLVVGCGYVGFPLGVELASRGHQVFGLRRSPPMEPAEATTATHQAAGLGGLTLLTADITQPATLETLPASYDWVVNCVSSSRGDAEDYRKVYLEGTRHLLSWLSRQPPRKFVYTSSTSVYAQTDGSTVTESSPTEPPGETGQILLETESYLLRATSETKFPALILRLAGIYGPRRGYWFKQFLNNEAVIEGAGNRVMNMIHRNDVIGAILAALERGRPGEIYNAVDDEPVSQRDFFCWFSDALQRPMPPRRPEDANAARKRGLTNKRVSNQKLKTELGYRFKFPTFREGCAEQVPDLA